MVNLKFWEGKKVLVTGHTGFKGSWLCETLLLAGAIVSGFALQPNEQQLFDLCGLKGHMNSHVGDVRNLKELKDVIHREKPEFIFHLAAQPLVRDSYNHPVETYATNVMGTIHLLEAIRECESVKSVVVVTTDKVYENKEWMWGYRENEHLCGLDPYSNSKSCAELVTYSYQNSFFNREDSPAISTARAGNVIGGGDFAKDRIIPDCMRAALRGEKIIIRNPDSIRPYQHVLDCLSGYLLLAQKQYEDRNYQSSYNFGPDEADCIETGKLANLFCEAWSKLETGGGITNCDCVVSQHQQSNGLHEANFLKLDCSKAKSVLGWKPKWGINEAINRTVEWIKAYENREADQCVRKQIKEYFANESK